MDLISCDSCGELIAKTVGRSLRHVVPASTCWRCARPAYQEANVLVEVSA